MLTNINVSIDEILTLCGLTDEVLAKELQEGLEAERLYLSSFGGKFLHARKAPDIPTRLKAVGWTGRMRDHFIDRHQLTGKDGGDIVLEIKPATQRSGPKTIEIDE